MKLRIVDINVLTDRGMVKIVGVSFKCFAKDLKENVKSWINIYMPGSSYRGFKELKWQDTRGTS